MPAIADVAARLVLWAVLATIAVLAPAAMAAEPARCAIDDPRVTVVGEFVVRNRRVRLDRHQSIRTYYRGLALTH